MGTDIHGVLQRRFKEDQGNWVTVSELDFSRNYRLFAVLAGVRNGSGFAGVKTHEPIQPIAQDRGLPDDIELVKDDEGYEGLKQHYGTAVWGLGEHSLTHMTTEEIRAWPHWDEGVVETGILDVEVYLEWLRDGGTPKAWCGGVSGPGVMIIDQVEAETANFDIFAKATHVRCSWQSKTFREMCKEFLSWLDYAEQRHGDYSDLRIIIGFDS